MKFPFRTLHSFIDAQRNFEAIEQPSFGTQLLSGQGIYTGSGAPSFTAVSGNYYFRTDTPGTANQRIYVCSGGSTWTGIL